MLSARRITYRDYDTIRAALTSMVANMQQRGTKLIHSILDVDEAMEALYTFDSFIVEDSFLVVYDVGNPWYSTDLILNELLVLRLNDKADFSVVPAFLEQQALEAGCRIIAAGTALARHDRSLEYLYSSHGFKTEAFTLTKELQWED